uniref:cobalamin binding intrinsic factor-like n=1 Tax=Pristiophorus japonicus TaxID=55135 RepID=UPI00398E3714
MEGPSLTDLIAFPKSEDGCFSSNLPPVFAFSESPSTGLEPGGQGAVAELQIHIVAAVPDGPHGPVWLKPLGQEATRKVTPEYQRTEVERLVQVLQNSANYQDPNPSVLIALRLAGNPFSLAERKLLEGLKENAVRNGASLSSGKLGLYVLALIASCEDPTRLLTSAQGTDTAPDLVTLLSNKLGQEMKNIEVKGHPLTTYYQVALALLGLCQQRSYISKSDVNTFTQAAMHDRFSFGHQFSVDTAAVAALALRCLQQGSYKPAESIRIASIKLSLQLFCAKTAPGTIGNLYSTGLAMQAFFANDKHIPSVVWDCRKTLQEVLAQVKQGAFQNPESASQILPPLVGKTYLDVDQVTCPKDVNNRPVPVLPAADSGEITVDYSVTDTLPGSQYFNRSITLKVPGGTTLLQVMRRAQEKQPEYFKFTEIITSWGPFITSIADIEATDTARTYWQFLNGPLPIPVGVAEYQPSDGEHIVAKFTTY